MAESHCIKPDNSLGMTGIERHVDSTVAKSRSLRSVEKREMGAKEMSDTKIQPELRNLVSASRDAVTTHTQVRLVKLWRYNHGKACRLHNGVGQGRSRLETFFVDMSQSLHTSSACTSS